MSEICTVNIVFVPKFTYWARTEGYFGKEFNAGKYKKTLL
jgi:hypothetical protein